MRFGTSRFNTKRFDIPNFIIYRGVAKLITSSAKAVAVGHPTIPVYSGAAKLSVSHPTFLGYYRSIVDDSDVSLTSSNFSWDLSINQGYNGTYYHYFFPGFGGSSAWWQWNHLGLLPDVYDIYATWVTNSNRPTSVKFEIITPGKPTTTVFVNQRIAPVGPEFGGVPFQKLGTVSVSGNTINVRVYGDDNYFSVADATMVSRINHMVAPTYTGRASLVKYPILSNLGLGIPPKFTGLSRLTVGKALFSSSASRILPVYIGGASLKKHPALVGVGNHVVPVYSGKINITVKSNIFGVANSIVPVYSGSSQLDINRVEIISDASHILPVYSGGANLLVKPVLVSNGVNIVEGFIYKSVLYITDKVLRENYVKLDEYDTRIIVNNVNLEW